MPVLKCRECDAPMNETRKGRPEKLPAHIKWLICRQCNKGIEFIESPNDPKGTAGVAPQSTIEAKEASKLDFEEKVTITNYVTITKITDKDGNVTTTKEIYSDKARKTLVSTEVL